MNSVLDMQRRLEGEGYSARTIYEYVKWGKRLARWAAMRGMSVAELEPADVRAWIDQTVPASRESRKQAYTALRHLFYDRTDEPWQAIRVPRKRRGKPWPLDERERCLLRDTSIMVGGRRGLATLGLLQTACRPSEVAVWRWDGVGDGRIRFWRTKVSDWHEVPLRPALAHALERFRPADAEAYVFPGDRGRPHITTATVYGWVQHVAEVAGIDGVNPRRLRATALSRVLEVTGSIDVAAELAGHSDVSVTNTYYVTTSWSRLTAGSAALD